MCNPHEDYVLFSGLEEALEWHFAEYGGSIAQRLSVSPAQPTASSPAAPAAAAAGAGVAPVPLAAGRQNSKYAGRVPGAARNDAGTLAQAPAAALPATAIDPSGSPGQPLGSGVEERVQALYQAAYEAASKEQGDELLRLGAGLPGTDTIVLHLV